MSTPSSIIPAATISPTAHLTSSPSPSPSSGGSNSGGATQNSPLLFFVALGFGVVFTNLWIIVGVKYCFRYNARNRARASGVDEVDLQAIGARPHRRRREKKLMTVDEVNERFPVTKYKTWRASREVMGLPSAGGIAPTDGTTPSDQTQSDIDPPSSPLPKIPEPVADPTKPATVTQRESQDLPTQPPATRPSTEIRRVESDRDHDDHDDDDAMPTVPVDMANAPGDTCAICIDNLEDTDDIRGLTCGHAFHTACIDPWLTSRRACCPLCKADYYVPKPRTEADIEAEEAARERRRLAATQLRRHPLSAWWYRGESYLAPGTTTGDRRSNRESGTGTPGQGSRWNPFNRNSGNAAPAGNTESSEVQQTPPTGQASFLGRFSRHSRANSRANANNSNVDNPTPSALEAGLAENNATSGTR